MDACGTSPELEKYIAFEASILRIFQLWTWLIRVSYVVIAFLPLPLTWTVWLCEVKIFYENPKNYWDGYRWDMTVDAFGVRPFLLFF